MTEIPKNLDELARRIAEGDKRLVRLRVHLHAGVADEHEPARIRRLMALIEETLHQFHTARALLRRQLWVVRTEMVPQLPARLPHSWCLSTVRARDTWWVLLPTL